MTARLFFSRLFKDGFLYMEFNIVVSIIYLLLGSPVFQPFFELFANTVSYKGMVACSSGVCWLIMCLLMMKLEKKRGYWETRVGFFSYPWTIFQKICSMLFAMLPIGIYYFFTNTGESPMALGYQPYMWVGYIFPGRMAILGTVLAAGLTFGLIFIGFYKGREAFVVYYKARSHGRLPNQDYAPEMPKGIED